MKEKIKNISLIVMAIALAISIAISLKLKSDYSVNENIYQMKSDSLITEVSLGSNRYDSLQSHSDSLFELQKASYDSLNELYKIKINTHKEQVTVIYKDSTVIRYVEDTHEEHEQQIQYVEKEVVKEVVNVIHDTVTIAKSDTVYNESNVAVSKSEIKDEKTVVDNVETFNIYIDGGVRANLNPDIIPELNAGIMIREKFYGEIGANYDRGKINPSAKLGIRLKVF